MVRDNVSICQMGIKRPAQNQHILDIAPDQLYMACWVFVPEYRGAMVHDSPLLGVSSTRCIRLIPRLLPLAQYARTGHDL